MKKSKEKTETTKIDSLTTAELKTMLKAISHTASAKHPELDDLVYIEACPSGQTLTFSTNDGVKCSRAMTVVPSGTIDRVRKLCVKFSAFAGFVGIEDSEKKTFDNEDSRIVFEITDDKLMLHGQGAKASRSLKIPKYCNEMLLPEFARDETDVIFSFGSASFLLTLNAVATAAAKDENRFALHGVCLRFTASEKTLTLCATDGHTCSEYELEFSSENSNPPYVDCEFLFSLDSIEALQKALKNAKDESRLTLNFRQNGEYKTGFFEFIAKGGNEVLLALPVANAKFPQTAHLFDDFLKYPETAVVRADSDVLSGMLTQLRKSAVREPDKSIKVVFSKMKKEETILLSDVSETYEASISAKLLSETSIPENATDSRFNPEKLATALEAFGGGNVCLCFNEKAENRLLITKPADLSCPLVSEHRRILMGQRKD